MLRGYKNFECNLALESFTMKTNHQEGRFLLPCVCVYAHGIESLDNSVSVKTKTALSIEVV